MYSKSYYFHHGVVLCFPLIAVVRVQSITMDIVESRRSIASYKVDGDSILDGLITIAENNKRLPMVFNRITPTKQNWCWCSAHTLDNHVYTRGFMAVIDESKRNRAPKRMRFDLDTDDRTMLYRLPEITTEQTPEARWTEFRDLTTHDALHGNLYLTTNCAQLIASIKGIHQDADLCDDLKALLGEVIVMMPLTRRTRTYLIGLRMFNVHHLGSTLRVNDTDLTSWKSAIGTPSMTTLVVRERSNVIGYTLVDVCKHLIRLHGFCSRLVANGHMILADLIASLHFLRYFEAIDRSYVQSYVTPTKRIHASDPGKLNMTYEQKIASMAISIGGESIADGSHFVESIMEIVSNHPLAQKMVVLIPERPNEYDVYDPTLLEAPAPTPVSSSSELICTSPESSPDLSDCDMSDVRVMHEDDGKVHLLTNHQVAHALRRNYDFWERHSRTTRGYCVLPLPAEIPHILSNVPDLAPVCNMHTPKSRGLTAKLRGLGEDYVVSPSFFSFLRVLYEMGVHIDLRLMNSIQVIRRTWRIKLPVVLTCEETIKIQKESERKLLMAIGVMYGFASSAGVLTKSAMSVSTQTAMIHRIVVYRINQLTTSPDDCPDFGTFWMAACDMINQMESTPPVASSTRRSLSSLLLHRSWTRSKHVNIVGSVYDDSTVDKKIMYVVDMLLYFDQILERHKSDPKGLTKYISELSFQYIMPYERSDGQARDTDPEGTGTVAHALTMLWKCIIDPDVGFFQPLDCNRNMHAPTAKLTEDRGYMQGLAIAVIASTIYGVLPTLRLHPYMLAPRLNSMIDEKASRDLEDPIHPLSALLRANTPETDTILTRHFDVLFHRDHGTYLDLGVADSYLEYETGIATAVQLHSDSLLPENHRHMWNKWMCATLQWAMMANQPDTFHHVLEDADALWTSGYALTCPLHNVPLDSIATAEYVLRHLKIKTSDRDVQQAFTRIIKALTPQKARAFLLFATGKERLLREESITLMLSSTNINPGQCVPCPSSHTCITQVYVHYDRSWTMDQFEENITKLLDISLEHCQTFGLR